MHTNLSNLRDLHRRVVRYSVELVRHVTAEDLTRPTPCSRWNLADLLSHMTAQHRGFAAAAAGQGHDLAHWEVHPPGSDLVAQYSAAADGVITAFAAVESPDQVFDLPEFGDVHEFPAIHAITFHFIDYVGHSWDVARSLNIPFDPDADLLEAALPVALAIPDGKSRLELGAAFGPALAAAGDDSSVLDRILLALGRSPGWPE